MNYIILQEAIMTLKKQSNTSIIVGIVVFFVFVILLIISGRSSGNGTSSGSRSSSRGRSGKYSKGPFRKRAVGMGLNKPEIRTLEYLIKTYSVKDPFNLLKNSKTLNSTLQKAFTRLEDDIAPQNVKEGQKLLLYRIKQKIERNSEKKQLMTGTKQLNPGQKLHLSTPGGTRYESQVSSNLKDYLGAKIPRDDHGNQIRWKKWTKIQVFFWKPNGQGYSFSSKVSGYNNIRGIPSLFLQHSKSIQQAQQR
ncbi:MAG: PilZ domain-containing protein, partial [Spirochaetales bacterium]|nr:PilZ domain-containing protein [Spirochaetales bacterium]